MDKIRDIRELADVLAKLRGEGKKIAHCHGVFDLLHIGHIKHLECAKKMGDALVVTVTPDRYVNKGPGRPVFSESLRAEALAALGCVDYVAINGWPTAVETIGLLKPHLYVKGADYRNAEDDITGKIADEEAAVKKTGGSIAFTNEIAFSSSHLANRHTSLLPGDAGEYLDRFSKKHGTGPVLGCLDKARSLRVLVVGEAIIDEYQYCDAIGKSSKEPTLVLKNLSTEKFAGGILAVANHLAGFCDEVTMITMLGALNTQEEFIRKNLRDNIEKIFLYRNDAPTIVKRRLIENYFFMKMMEIYEINDLDLEEADNKSLCGELGKRIGEYDLVVVVDYGHGFLSKDAIDILCGQSRFLAVNTQSNAGNLGYHTISMYPHADYVTATENEIRLEARDRRGDIEKLVENVANSLNCQCLAITRGKDGCLCYGRDGRFVRVPAVALKVVDRIGAGDAFLAISALCAAQGAPIEVIGFIGNVAGAEAVSTVGNRKPIERMALLRHIETLLK